MQYLRLKKTRRPNVGVSSFCSHIFNNVRLLFSAASDLYTRQSEIALLIPQYPFKKMRISKCHGEMLVRNPDLAGELLSLRSIVGVAEGRDGKVEVWWVI